MKNDLSALTALSADRQASGRRQVTFHFALCNLHLVIEGVLMQASLFYLLLLIHLIVDFMQPAALVTWSKSNSWGLLVHSGIYAILNVVALAFTPLWWLCASIFGISHFILDKIKITLNDKVPQASLPIFILDQVIHIAIITLVFFLARLGVSEPLPKILEVMNYPRVLLYVVGYVAVTFGGSILVFEVSNYLEFDADSKKAISIKERYQGILERAIAVTLILLGHLSHLFLLATPLAFILSLIQGKRVWQSKGERAHFLLELTTSVCLAFSAGIILYFTHPT